MFSCKNIFFPVGQGGFMYSRIENNGKKELDFIYDCGSLTTGFKIDNFLDKIPIKYFEDKIDYLYISHFDTDHINGIKKLCELVEFRKIIYPFNEDKNYRLLNTIYQISKSDDTEIDTDILKIIYNPEDNLPSITGEAILIGIKQTQEPETVNQNALSSKKETTKINAEKKGYHIKSLANIDWILYSFYPALKTDVDIKGIADDFKNFLNKNYQTNNLDDFLKNDKLKGKLKTKIKDYFKTEILLDKHQMENLDKSDTNIFNMLSLMLYSGIKPPKTQSEYSLTSTKIIFHQAEYPLLSDCLVPFLSNFRYRYKPKAPKDDTYALLLTGDAQLKGIDWHGYLKSLKENITTVNLPHHGSSNNTNNKTFEGFKNIKNFLTFAGNKTLHGHPTEEAMICAIEAQPTANIIHVNQFQGLFEMVVIE